MLVVQAPTPADACHVAGDGACTLDQRHGGLGPGRSGTSNRSDAVGNGAVMAIYYLEHLITGYFYGIIHSINGVLLVLKTGITRAITVDLLMILYFSNGNPLVNRFREFVKFSVLIVLKKFDGRCNTWGL